MPEQKNILLIEDISLIGRCSAMTGVPVLSCAGVSCVLMPTALLSSHTGGFDRVHRLDLTRDMEGILAQWSALGLRFDAICLGYLAGAHQLCIVEKILERFRAPGTLLFLDPVMGDRGRRYAFLTGALEAGFRKIAAQADLILPNPTEAALLLGQEAPAGSLERAEAGPVLRKLLDLGARGAVLSSVRDGAGGLGVAVLTRDMRTEQVLLRRERPLSYPGTGDLMAAALIGALLRGWDLPDACGVALDFLCDCLDEAERQKTEPRFGLPFETCLPGYAGRLRAR